MKNRPIWRRFGFAISGLKAGFKSEKSVRAHVAVTATVAVFLLLLQPAPVWWALFLLAAGLMLAVELVNTAVEKLADHLHPGQHDAIKTVKDTLAAAVLVSCLAAGGLAVIFLWTQL